MKVIKKEPKKACIDFLDYLRTNVTALLDSVGRRGMKPEPPKKPHQISKAGPLKLTNGVIKAKSKPNGDLIDFDDDDWSSFISNRTTAAPDTETATTLPSTASAGNTISLSEKIRITLEALRNVLMMNPGGIKIELMHQCLSSIFLLDKFKA